MPQVKIHLPASIIEDQKKSLLVHEIRACMPPILKVAENIGQVFLYETSPPCRSIHESRDPYFVFVEISMYSGRTLEMKHALTDRLIAIIHRHTSVKPADIVCAITEIPPENYFGGTSRPNIENLKKK
ncbi:MAG: hypothetical protein EHM45_19585 [Desulfobacteraceae bacterium]|nr:MAG: hypothetical protein EHM45_19585 [Desulfobacteraceae bacterium]